MVTGRGGYSLLFASYKRNSAKLVPKHRRALQVIFQRTALAGLIFASGA